MLSTLSIPHAQPILRGTAVPALYLIHDAALIYGSDAVNEQIAPKDLLHSVIIEAIYVVQ